MITSKKSKTDITIATLDRLFSRKRNLSVTEFLAIESNKALAKNIGFNPLLTSYEDAYDKFLLWRIYVDKGEHTPLTEFDKFLSDCIRQISVGSHSADVLDKVAEKMYSRIATNRFSPDVIYENAYLVCSTLRSGRHLSARIKNSKLFSRLVTSPFLKLPLDSKDTHRRIVVENAYSSLEFHGSNIDTYEKLNDIFVPFIDNLYEVIATKQIPSLDLIDDPAFVSLSPYKNPLDKQDKN